MSRWEEGIFTEGEELAGHSVSAVVIWGKSRDFLCPSLKPWSSPVSFVPSLVLVQDGVDGGFAASIGSKVGVIGHPTA